MSYKPSKKVLEDMYINQNMTMKEIASLLGFSVGSIHKYIHQYGIPPKPKGSWMVGVKMPNKNKALFSKGNKGRVVTDEQRRKISESSKQGGIGHKKLRADGYVSVYFPDHPKSTKEGYIMEHVLVMECLVGRWLRDDEVVHHKNHVRSDNRAENLELMTKSEHMSLHTTERHKNKSIPHKTVSVKNLDTGETFKSVDEAAQKYDINSTLISRVCRGKRNKTAGCRWGYIEGSEDLSIQ